MKTKLFSLILLAALTMALLTGCSGKETFSVQLLKGNEMIASASSDAEAKLTAVKSEDGSPLFKSVSVSENKGLFYNSYTVNATTNATSDTTPYALKVTMPGEIAQVKDGIAENGIATFKIENMKQENDFAVYSESNNTGTVIVILCILAVIGSVFIFIMKRKQG